MPIFSPGIYGRGKWMEESLIHHFSFIWMEEKWKCKFLFFVWMEEKLNCKSTAMWHKVKTWGKSKSNQGFLHPSSIFIPSWKMLMWHAAPTNQIRNVRFFHNIFSFNQIRKVDDKLDSGWKNHSSIFLCQTCPWN